MTVSSMTGFARVEGQIDGFVWVWEIRSVNGKSLDIKLRLPTGWDALEGPCRVDAVAQLGRGSVSATLTVSEAARPAALRINQTVLAQVVDLMRSLEGLIEAAPARLDGILGIRGILEVAEEPVPEGQREARTIILHQGFGDALRQLSVARGSEGERTATILAQRLTEIEGYIAEAETAALAVPAQIRARFQRQLTTLFNGAPPLSEDRLAQELTLLITRADIREELDRLSAHIGAARELLREGINIGRRFDFLCQEFNREANTLCSKSADIGLTNTGLALKAAIEQLREQVQNIE